MTTSKTTKLLLGKSVHFEDNLISINKKLLSTKTADFLFYADFQGHIRSSEKWMKRGNV
jgi:hypothetical protein